MLILNQQQRGGVTLHNSQVVSIVPDVFNSEYPNLVKFIQSYYEYLQSRDGNGFADIIQNLHEVRQLSTADLEILDLLLGEIGNGLQSASFFRNPRLMARLLAGFYRSKGTILSAEQFFKAFFNQEVEVSYPKRNIFILNESKLGASSLKFLTDNKRYQIFSILLKTGMSSDDYIDLYTKFVHPAGFYIGHEVGTEGHARIGIRAGVTTDPLEPPNYPIEVQATPIMMDVHSSFDLMTMEETDQADVGIIISSMERLMGYENVTFNELIDQYTTIENWVSVKPNTMDNVTANLVDFDNVNQENVK